MFVMRRTLELPIEKLGLSLTAQNPLLRRKEDMKVRDLCNMTEEDLLSIHGIGRKSLREVKETLAKYGLFLATSRNGLNDTPQDTCGSCRFWVLHCSVGECHRYPPVWSERGTSHFPPTESDEWCGEWKTRER